MAEPSQPTQIIHRVLIVDDDYELADLLSEVLTFENCAVDLASNGMEAIEKLRGADYEAIICDLMMPRMDGETLYNEATKQFPYLADRFLFITSQAAQRGGFSDFVSRTGNNLLEKPLEVEQLRAALQELLQR
jgi:two-component system, cell cycle sensor histidine kinase and response regulator CckA